MQHFPGRARLYVIKEEDSLLFFLAYFSFFDTHPKTTGLLQLLIFSHPSFSFSFLRYFLVVSKHLFGKEKTNKKHAASLFQRGYDSRRERESEAGERGAVEREANGTSSFDFFFL
jgi:hypothetical protein